MTRVEAAIFIERKIQKYIKDLNKLHTHDVFSTQVKKTKKLIDILEEMGFKHGYREIDGKVKEVLIDIKDNSFYEL